MSLVNHRSFSPASSTANPLHLDDFRFLARSLLLPHESEPSLSTRHQVVETFAGKWFNKYWDIRWFMLREIEFVSQVSSVKRSTYRFPNSQTFFKGEDVLP